jgi:hypothetical protein
MVSIMYIDRSALLQQEVQLLAQLIEQIQRYAKLISRETLELLAIDAKKQVTDGSPLKQYGLKSTTFSLSPCWLQVPRFLHQCYDTMDLALHGRISWRIVLGDNEDHRDSVQEVINLHRELALLCSFQWFIRPRCCREMNSGRYSGQLCWCLRSIQIKTTSIKWYPNFILTSSYLT